MYELGKMTNSTISNKLGKITPMRPLEKNGLEPSLSQHSGQDEPSLGWSHYLHILSTQPQRRGEIIEMLYELENNYRMRHGQNKTAIVIDRPQLDTAIETMGSLLADTNLSDPLRYCTETVLGQIGKRVEGDGVKMAVINELFGSFNTRLAQPNTFVRNFSEICAYVSYPPLK